jgi:polysaccharide deacetylase 2 family uncharacterized protein YibQ
MRKKRSAILIRLPLKQAAIAAAILICIFSSNYIYFRNLRALHSGSEAAYDKGSRYTAAFESYACIALILDVSNADVRTIERLSDLNLKINFAIIPFSANTNHTAEIVHKDGQEVMLHIPVIPGNDSAIWTNSGLQLHSEGIGVSKVRNLILDAYESVPHVRGMDLQLLSEMSLDEDMLSTILDIVKARSSFLLWNGSSNPESNKKLINKKGVLIRNPDVVLTKANSVKQIRSFFQKAAGIAVKNGSAVAKISIDNKNADIFSAVIAEKALEFAERKIDFIFLSELVLHNDRFQQQK